MHRIFTAKKITRVGTWNLRTLYQRGSMSQVLKEMTNYSLQELGISKMRRTGQEQFCSEGYRHPVLRERNATHMEWRYCSTKKQPVHLLGGIL